MNIYIYIYINHTQEPLGAVRVGRALLAVLAEGGQRLYIYIYIYTDR